MLSLIFKFLAWTLPLSPLWMRWFFRPLRGGSSRASSVNILVVRLDEIGDFVLFTPFLKGLRAGQPSAWITLVVRPINRSLAETCPFVNQVLVFEPKAHRLWGPYQRFLRARSFVRTHLAGRPWDVAFLPRWDLDLPYGGSWIVWGSGAGRRIGYSSAVDQRKRILDWGKDLLFTDARRDGGIVHETDRSLRLLETAGMASAQPAQSEVWLLPSDRAKAREVLAPLVGHRLVAVAPGASYANKQWPVDRFVAVARACSAPDIAWVIVGGPEDRPSGEAFLRGLGGQGLNLAGELSLRASAAVMERCVLYLGNDTGPMHLAAAMGLPVVAIFRAPIGLDPLHIQSPDRFAPSGRNIHILRPAAHLPPCQSGCQVNAPHCILGVSVEEGLQAMRSILSPKRG